jgi:hypothetical protein
MSFSTTRCFFCWVFIVIVPVSLLGQTPSAILHAQGGVWVNDNEAKDSSTVFPGDKIETKTAFSANLALEGSAVLIQPQSVTTLKDNLLELDHGGVAVETSRNFKVRVHCITVTPVLGDFTQYDVNDVNGTVHVAAHKKDVNVAIEGHHKPNAENPESQGGSVREGEEHDYDESKLCPAAAKPPEAKGLDPKWLAIGAGGTALLICVILPCWGGSNNKKPLSQDTP